MPKDSGVFDSSQGYVAVVGEKGKTRLELQNEIFEPGTRSFLLRAGLKKGMTVLDIGSGSGAVSRMMAEIVGETGQVIAVDISLEHLEVSKKIANGKFKNIEYLHSSVLDLSKFNFAADFVYCRFMLMHVKEHVRAIEKMAACLKPEGIFACEEPRVSACTTEPESSAFKKSIDLLMTWSKQLGVDYDIGSKMFELLKKLGFQSISKSISQPVMTTPKYKKISEMLMAEMKEIYIANKIADASTVDNLIIQLNEEVTQPMHVKSKQCELFQLFALKPKQVLLSGKIERNLEG